MLAAIVARSLRRPLLFITPHLDQADNARDDFETIANSPAELLPAWEGLPGEGAGSDEISAERTRLCHALLQSKTKSPTTLRDSDPPKDAVTSQLPLIVAPVQALTQPVPSPAALEANALALHKGQRIEPEQVAAWLTDRGFQRLDKVEEPGDFAIRGGILDIFASTDTDPYRVEFFGDEIESLRQFDIGSQRSMRSMDVVRIARPPDPSHLNLDQTTTFLNYLPLNALVVLHEPLEIIEIARTVLDRLGRPVGHFPIESILERIAAFQQVHFSRFPGATVAESDTITLDCEPIPTFDAKTIDAVTQLVTMAREEPVIVYCDNKGEQDRLQELIDQALTAEAETLAEAPDAPPPPDTDASLPPAPRISLQIGLIHQGFRWRAADTPHQNPPRKRWAPGPHGESDQATAKRQAHGRADPTPMQTPGPLAILPHHELFRRYAVQRRIRPVTSSRAIDSFVDLSEGDYVVHLVHGIGRFAGMRTMRKGDSKKTEEYLTIRFADNATMHVPVSQIDLVHKYIGSGGGKPTLSKLGGARWQTTKQKVEDAVDDLAGDLLRIQAVRESQPGISYPNDTHWQTEFENAFLYTETPDQLSTLADIKSDMARPRPMDRLLCGDVGYGKTELAMRAAFKAIEFGKQVAVLVPTTILAEQHFRTFRERMADYPFTIERVNRFRPTREQKDVLARAKKGHVDVLIGTHRLVSKDVDFSDLGLVIIDEEQRFGVEHKERLKQLRATVDILTLTATPIPRTLHMSMIGLRDISSLATPPMDRRAIATRVTTWDDRMIREAMLRELTREGQIYFVHNRVKSIEKIANRVRALVPEARVIVGHGQMEGEELERIMMQFINREADILVSTNIIESGLDIPTANTIFIDRADMFGLADLHQLRGRVGRYKHRAYCYLLLSPDKPITCTAAKRLKAIEQYSELGAGFRIAMRDLEIRGAGNLLGQEQSGNIAAVGYELYCQLLDKCVKRMKGERQFDRVTVHLELDVEAHIPRGYITSDQQRMECYRRFAACHTVQDVELLEQDLRDAFGRYPETVETLLTLAEIKVRAAPWGIRSIIKREPDVIFKIEAEVRQLEPLFTDPSPQRQQGTPAASGLRPGRSPSSPGGRPMVARRLQPLELESDAPPSASQGKISFPDPDTLYWRLPDKYFQGNTLLTILRNLFRKADPPKTIPHPKKPPEPKPAEIETPRDWNDW